MAEPAKEAKKAVGPEDEGRVAELEREVAEKKERIAELEKALSDEGRAVCLEDSEVEEVKKSYNDRLRDLDSVLNDSSPSMMKKYLMNERTRSKKLQAENEQMRAERRESNFMLTKKEKQIAQLQEDMKKRDIEYQRSQNDLKKKHNDEIDEYQRKIDEMNVEMEKLRRNQL